MQGDKIPDEIMREADLATQGHNGVWINSPEGRAILASALMARDKRAAEIARDKANRRLKAATQSIDPNTQQAQAQFGHQIATAILTYGDRDERR